MTTLGTLYLVLTFGQTRRSADAAVAASEHAARSAAAAEKSLSAMQDSTRLQLRPVVHHAIMRVSVADGHSPGMAIFELRNAGQTSATELQTNFRYAVTRWPPTIDLPMDESEHWTTPTVLPPGGSSVLEQPIPEWTRNAAAIAHRYMGALLVTLRVRYVGGDGHAYASSVDLICTGKEAADGRMAQYDPIMREPRSPPRPGGEV